MPIFRHWSLNSCCASTHRRVVDVTVALSRRIILLSRFIFMDEVQTVRQSRSISGEVISACSLFRVKVFHTQSIHRGDVITSTVQHCTISGVLALRMCGRAHSSVQAENYLQPAWAGGGSDSWFKAGLRSYTTRALFG